MLLKKTYAEIIDDYKIQARPAYKNAHEVPEQGESLEFESLEAFPDKSIVQSKIRTSKD